ncbi:stalk domain-containing protein [Priestia filamentosa]|uniref:stalk domain-containing protein n=1 Tax=Priestia filamentosa TaxID=1402861 RepID=UPI003982A2F5
MFKKIALLLILVIGFIAASSPPANAATTPPKIYVNGSLLRLTSKPIVKNGTTLIPVRQVAEAIGLTVVFNSSTNTITFKHPYRSAKVNHKIGTDSVYADGKYKGLQAPSIERNGVTYVPIRLFEAFDATVFWDANKNSIYVYSYELKQLQAVVFSNLAYSNALRSYKEGTDLKEINFNKLGIRKSFEDVQSLLGIYVVNKEDPLPVDSFLKDYVHIDEWELVTYLKEEDFANESSFKTMQNSKFKGYVFRNYKTNEYMISFAGTEIDEPGDVAADYSIMTRRVNSQKKYAYQLFQKITKEKSKPTIYLTGHSLGGNLAQATARNFPHNYKQAYTFNAYGINDETKDQYSKKVINSRVYADPISAQYVQYGRTYIFKVRTYKDKYLFSAHKIFNFYGYYLLPNTKYWNKSDFPVPYVNGSPNYLWMD